MTNVRIQVEVKCAKTALREAGQRQGLRGVALTRFSQPATHVVEYSVDPVTGEHRPVGFDGHPVIRIDNP